MRYKLLILLCLGSFSVAAQDFTGKIYGTWIISHVSYKDGSELSEDNILKHIYIKYTFRESDELFAANVYFENGSIFKFEINNDYLLLKSTVGNVLNTIRIDKLTKDELILQQKGLNGFEDPTALKYSFTRENIYQQSIGLTIDDIISIKHNDTIFRESPKLYAAYKGLSFARYLYDRIGEGNVDNHGGHLLATFTVFKNGIADSLRIIEGISPEFDKAYTKAFYKARKDWNPAVINGLPVSVKMDQELRYGIFDENMPAYFDTQKANDAFHEKQYETALLYYDKSLAHVPFDKVNLYNRGICKMMLGNMDGACKDWNKIKELGGTEADELLKKYCK